MARPARLGAYAKLSATYYRDDAILAAGDLAEVLFTRSLAFCAESSSDGYITDRQVKVIGVGLKAMPKRIASLIEEGLWERIDGGYIVRSWLKWNRSAEEAGMVRRKDRERKASVTTTEVAAEIPADIPTDSERNPDGFRDTTAPDSLSEAGQVKAGQVKPSQGRESAPTDDPTSALLIEHVNAYSQPPPLSAQAKTKVAVMGLVAEGVTPDRIRAGLHRMRDRKVGPTLLPQLVAETTPTRDPTKSTADQRLDTGRALIEKYSQPQRQEIAQ